MPGFAIYLGGFLIIVGGGAILMALLMMVNPDLASQYVPVSGRLLTSAWKDGVTYLSIGIALTLLGQIAEKILDKPDDQG